MVGKIISIKNGFVYVNLTVNVYDMDNLIGKNVTFDNRFIGEIINMSSSALEVSIIGEIVNDRFATGNMLMPKFGSECRLTTKEEIDKIYGVSATTDIIRIGKSYIYGDYSVCLNVNNFFANHFAILGNSGSGKSYFVSRLLQGIFYDAKRVPINTNILPPLHEGFAPVEYIGNEHYTGAKVNKINDISKYLSQKSEAIIASLILWYMPRLPKWP